MDKREKEKKNIKHTTGIDTTLFWSESVLDIDMIPISEARKDKFLWRMACIERPKRSAVLLCVKKINRKISDQKDTINR